MREYTYMIHQLNMNVPLEQIWKEFADRVGQEDVSNFVSVFVAAKRAGGDSIEMIRNAVKQICEKIEVKREIEMTMSAKKVRISSNVGGSLWNYFLYEDSISGFCRGTL